MATTMDGLRIRRALGRREWGPPRVFGPDGWVYQRRDRTASIIVSCSEHDGVEWLHASIARPDRTPDYDDLRLLWEAVFGDGWAYQVFAPTAEHVNIHEHCLHLWGRADGGPALPVFAVDGSI